MDEMHAMNQSLKKISDQDALISKQLKRLNDMLESQLYKNKDILTGKGPSVYAVICEMGNRAPYEDSFETRVLVKIFSNEGLAQQYVNTEQAPKDTIARWNKVIQRGWGFPIRYDASKCTFESVKNACNSDAYWTITSLGTKELDEDLQYGEQVQDFYFYITEMEIE